MGDRPAEGRHVVVAGGGITGLAAALDLAEAGAQVTVVEATARTGGMLVTSPFAGRMVDEGADAFLLRTPAAVELARRVGLEPGFVHPAERRAHVWSRGALRPLPPQLMGVPLDLDAVAASGLLSEAGLARLRADLTDPAQPLGPDDASIAEALGTRLGPEAIERLVDPLVGGINGGDTALQSLAAVVPQLDAARRDPAHASLIEACRAQVATARAAGVDPQAPIFAAPTGGMERLPEAVAAAATATGRVEVRHGSPVAEVEPAAGGTVRVVLADGTTLVADGVVVATPGPVAARLLATVSPDAGARLGQVDHVTVAFLRLAIPAAAVGRTLDGSGMLVPRVEGLTTTACSWASSKWAHLAPEHGDGTVVLRAAVGRDGDQAGLELDDPDLIARVVDELTPILDLAEGPTEAGVRRWTDAFPQYRPGHLDLVASVEATLALDAPRVAVAGMHLRGVGIPASVASAHAAAGRVLASLSPTG